MITSAQKVKEEIFASGASVDLERLIAYARNGDYEAFDRIVKFYWAPIYKMAYYRVRSKMDAEDITQEVFASAFKRISTLKEVSKFRPWLYTIAINRIRDYKRKKKLLNLVGIMPSSAENEMEEYGAEADDTPLDSAIKKDFWMQVDRFISRLSKLEREVFVLRFLDQLNINEIAEVMGKGQSTVKTHLYRALKKFREDSRFQTFLEGLQ